jgi:hypothetical protein
VDKVLENVSYLTFIYVVEYILYKILNFYQYIPFEFVMGAGVVGAWLWYLMNKRRGE